MYICCWYDNLDLVFIIIFNFDSINKLKIRGNNLSNDSMDNFINAFVRFYALKKLTVWAKYIFSKIKYS